MDQFIACLEGLEDPRTGNAGRHDFYELLMIAFCTVLCGGQSAVDMARFAVAKQTFLRGFLTLKHGPRATIPSAACSDGSTPTSAAPRSSTS